jgi:hypothetical protein
MASVRNLDVISKEREAELVEVMNIIGLQFIVLASLTVSVGALEGKQAS